jgi:hypothetical protein
MRLFFAFCILMSSCKNEPKAVQVKETTSELVLVHSPSIQFPTVPYDSVALYSVDETYYNSDDLEKLETKVMNAAYTNGLAIIDSLGRPSSKYYIRHRLSEKELIELQAIFHLPPNKGELSEPMCIPYYRDAFVFYQKQRQVAQAQICLHCRQAYFTPDTSSLAERFTSDGDWGKMQTFTKTVKAR